MHAFKLVCVPACVSDACLPLGKLVCKKKEVRYGFFSVVVPGSGGMGSGACIFAFPRNQTKVGHISAAKSFTGYTTIQRFQ